jgi:ArsR family transcriptional regulator
MNAIPPTARARRNARRRRVGVRVAQVLSNPDRLLLLCELSQGERCVSDLEARLDIRQPTLSQQLGVLRDNALVQTRREGKNIHYSLDSPAAIAVMGVLYEQFCGPAATRRRHAD